MVVCESCHKKFLKKHEIQNPQAPDRQHVSKLPGNESEHVTQNSHVARPEKAVSGGCREILGWCVGQHLASPGATPSQRHLNKHKYGDKTR